MNLEFKVTKKFVKGLLDVLRRTGQGDKERRIKRGTPMLNGKGREKLLVREALAMIRLQNGRKTVFR